MNIIKVCITCNRLKSLDKFHNHKGNRDGKRSDCKECKNTKNKNWIKNNKERWKELKKLQRRRERRTVKGNINCRMSRAIRDSLEVKNIGGKTNRRWEDIVGYTVHDLKIHLEKKFTGEMNWELFISGKIHIDHIKPKSKFSYKSLEDTEFKDCWSLENLQPLYARDNMRKGAQFQL